ncbi:hypothetical protein AAG570_005756 [Ranatra chinensis]|uniref:Uncharacterized protein n=1 Tax=Ranatra chinensis TaxID=642074 RepID=A0ABD0XYC5_9HEMI
MASKRRNMFYENEKQETTEIDTCNLPSSCETLYILDVGEGRDRCLLNGSGGDMGLALMNRAEEVELFRKSREVSVVRRRPSAGGQTTRKNSRCRHRPGEELEEDACGDSCQDTSGEDLLLSVLKKPVANHGPSGQPSTSEEDEHPPTVRSKLRNEY